MPQDPSSKVNNMKRSFNSYLSGALTPSVVNFDQDPFDTSSLDEWYAVRYTDYSSESSGMGDVIDESGSSGRFHVL